MSGRDHCDTGKFVNVFGLRTSLIEDPNIYVQFHSARVWTPGEILTIVENRKMVKLLYGWSWTVNFALLSVYQCYHCINSRRNTNFDTVDVCDFVKC